MAIATVVASGTVVGNLVDALVRCVVVAIVTSEAPRRIVVAKVVRVDSLAYILGRKDVVAVDCHQGHRGIDDLHLLAFQIAAYCER
jgi:hypothetical protein